MTDITQLTDAEVLQWARTANEDAIEAARTQFNSEWHEQCFAACVVLAQEMTRRGISLNTTH